MWFQTSHFACVELIERGVRERRHVILSKFIQITCLFFPAICVNMAAFRPQIESSPKLQERYRKESKEHSCCITCGVKTNYVCIQCSTSVCNRCSRFENNESCKGWEAGRSVAYCLNCSSFMFDNNEEEINASVDSHATTKISSIPGGTVSGRFVLTMCFPSISI